MTLDHLKCKPIPKFDGLTHVHHKRDGKLNIMYKEFNYKHKEWEYYCDNNEWYLESQLN